MSAVTVLVTKPNEWARDLILGGQDGLVSTLGICLGLSASHAPWHSIIVAGVAALCAESVSMGDVKFSSDDAAGDAVTIAVMIQAAITVALTCAIGSAIPLLPYIFHLPYSPLFSAGIAAVALFLAGVYVSYLDNRRPWLRGGVKLMLLGMAAAVVGLLAGRLLR